MKRVLKPTATNSSSMTRTGGTTDHGVLADESDATYLTAPVDNASVYLAFTDPSPPPGAAIRDITFSFRQHGPTPFYWVTRLDINDGSYGPWFISTEGTVTLSGQPITAAFNAAGTLTADLLIQAQKAGGIVYEAQLDVVYVEKPVVTVTAPSGLITNTNMPTIEWTMT